MNKIDIDNIETFSGFAIPLPDELQNICRENTENIYQLQLLIDRMQKYLAAESPESKNELLTHVIFKLRDLSLVYPHLKETFVDFIVDNAQHVNLNCRLKTIILMKWIDQDEDIIKKSSTEKAEKNESAQNYNEGIIANLRQRIDSLFRFNVS